MVTRREAIGGAAALGVLGLAGEFTATSSYASALRLGEHAPPATLVTLDGQRMSTADLLGQVVVLTFWATWCVPCRQELPLLSEYFSQYSAQGLTVLGFSLDSPDKIPQVTHIAHSLSFPNGLLANSSAPGYGRMWKIPVNFTIDRSGRLVDDGWKDKYPTWTPERLQQVVTPLLEK
jgi:cytochrome c biogenesis protein CcmG/thiol:disulfide interchange protein DsbE